MSPTLSARLDRVIADLPQAYPGPGGAVAVVKDGQVLVRHAWGFANAELRIPFTPRSLFRMCSITKQFTCAAMLDAVPDPAALDEAVRAQLPRLEGPAPAAAHLAHNQSGLRDYWAVAMLLGAPAESPFGDHESRLVIGATRDLQFAPGTRFSYSNNNFRILSDALEGRTGRLTVRLESFLPDKNFLQVHPEIRLIEYTRLTIADTGIGMDARTLERIFEPFFTTKPVGKGTGLGLAVVHGIIQSHEGAIIVESKVGEGTTFNLYFPAQAAEATLTDAMTISAPRGHGEKVLLVDDEVALTTMFRRLLQRLNYQVTTCNSAREAVEIFRQNPAQFDVAITDLTMPEMNGLEVARQLVAIRASLPVVLASGYSAALKEEHLREAGVCELLEKPVSLHALAEVLQRALSKI